MKPSTTARVLLGLLSASVMMITSQAHQQCEVTEQGTSFRVSHFDDGRTTPYRVYFWNKSLTGSSYRFEEDGGVPFFKAGSRTYFDPYETTTGKLKYLSKREHHKNAHQSNNEFDAFDCAQCTAAVSAICDSGLPPFCDGLDPECLQKDGTKSVGILCDNYMGVCTTLAAKCAEVCSDEPGESFRHLDFKYYIDGNKDVCLAYGAG